MHAAPMVEDAFHETRQPASPLVVLALNDGARCAALEQALTADGYEVVTMRDGAALLQYLYNSVTHEARPDLVVCDAELDGVDGAQVCLISRSQDALLPFIVIARNGPAGAFDSLELFDEACVLSADVDLEELKAAVRRLL
ncbi:MAG: response regulator [Myxococcaceae bacterium]|nr:response regulator [Myxococcaceae bacterium]